MITITVSVIASIIGFLLGYFFLSPVLSGWLAPVIGWFTGLDLFGWVGSLFGWIGGLFG